MKKDYFNVLSFIFGVAVILFGVYILGVFFYFQKDMGKLEYSCKQLKVNHRQLAEEKDSLKKK